MEWFATFNEFPGLSLKCNFVSNYHGDLGGFIQIISAFPTWPVTNIHNFWSSTPVPTISGAWMEPVHLLLSSYRSFSEYLHSDQETKQVTPFTWNQIPQVDGWNELMLSLFFDLTPSPLLLFWMRNNEVIVIYLH